VCRKITCYGCLKLVCGDFLQKQQQPEGRKSMEQVELCPVQSANEDDVKDVVPLSVAQGMQSWIYILP
jgi:hypothetical protein